ncbi:MAG TPA: hypothetical protein VFI47_14905 [Acidimicrobiales bacterium]|nr:hypothetical protein [Acidimicrobiales bacterium]
MVRPGAEEVTSSPVTSSPVTVARGRTAGLHRRWVAAMVAGELVGFVPPAVTGAVLAAAGAPDAVLVPALTLAGLCEGAVLGAAQARVLGRYAPGVDRRAWVVATAAAAGWAWLAGMGGSAVMAAGAPLPVLVLVVPAWMSGLLAMGWAQWRVLRLTLPRSGRWIWVTAGAWLVGVAIPVATLSAVPAGWPAAAGAASGVAAAVAMGLTVGAITGRTLGRLLATGGRPAVTS